MDNLRQSKNRPRSGHVVHQCDDDRKPTADAGVAETKLWRSGKTEADVGQLRQHDHHSCVAYRYAWAFWVWVAIFPRSFNNDSDALLALGLVRMLCDRVDAAYL